MVFDSARFPMNNSLEEAIDPAPVPVFARVVARIPVDHGQVLEEIRCGLLAPEASINPKYFYDSEGCALFGAICTTQEYYLTRTEAAIFARHGAEIRGSLPESIQWIDLGCGDGGKSPMWLEATAARRFIGVDIAQDWLLEAVRKIAARFPGVDCVGVATDFADALSLQDIVGERPELDPVFFYPGSSLGNFSHAGALRFLASIRDHLDGGGSLLVGVDLVKDVQILERAYNDAQGLTAAFNRNVLRVANRLLGADFDPERFEHLAEFNHRENRIEMRLRSSVSQRVWLGTKTRIFAEGSCILTEHCHKYSLHGFADLLARAGFSQNRVWTDPDGAFAVFLGIP